MSASLPSTPPDFSAAAATAVLVESTIAPALFLLILPFTVTLFVLVLYNTPHIFRGDTRSQARVAYAIIGTLAVVSTLTGALPFGRLKSARTTAVLQALLSFVLGIPILHLASSHAPRKLFRLLQWSFFAILLSTATLFGFFNPLLPSLSAVCPRYLPSALFLAYSALALPRIAVTFFRFLRPSSNSTSNSTSISNPSIKSFLASRRKVCIPRRPITIHVETHRTSIPLSLPSPASSATSLPLSDSHNAENSIELDIVFPKGKDNRSRLNEDSVRAPYPYQDEKSRPENSSPKDEKHCPTKHDKTPSLDSTSSTIRSFSPPRTRYRSHSPPLSCLPSSLPLVSLTTPPRVAYTAAFTADPDLPPFTDYVFQRGEEHIYRFPRTEGGSIENHEEVNPLNEVDRAQHLYHHRSRKLLVFLFAAQLTLLVGYACEFAAAISASGISLSIFTSTTVSLKTVQAACTVVAIAGTMSAYILHAYNAETSSARQGRNPLLEHYRPSQSGPSSIQIDPTSDGRTHPVVIRLAPPPPPRTRRKRADALGSSVAPAGLPHSVVDQHLSSEFKGNHGENAAAIPIFTGSRGSLTGTAEIEEATNFDSDPDKGVKEDDQVVNGALDFEGEMRRALLRSNVIASSAVSDASDDQRAGRTEIRSAQIEASILTLGPDSTHSKSRNRKSTEDPAVYIRKRGSIPPAMAPKRLFGWEFGWDPLPKRRTRGSEKGNKQMQASSFLDFKGVGRKESDKTKNMKAPVPTTRKLKHYSSPAVAGHHRSLSSREAAKMEKLEDILGIGVALSVDPTTATRKPVKRSKSAIGPDKAVATERDLLASGPFLQSAPWPAAVASERNHRKIKSTSTSASTRTATSRPGTADSKTSSGLGHRSSGSLGTRPSIRKDSIGLQLKKSFKLGVGRTLGPHLTLASAGLGYGSLDEKHEKIIATLGTQARESDVEKSADRQDAEEDDDDHSVAAAKLVSASIARITPAATIPVPPSSPTTPSPTAQSTRFRSSLINFNISYPPPATHHSLSPIITSAIPNHSPHVKAIPLSAPGLTTAPTHDYSPRSSKSPHTNDGTSRTHPFADPAEEGANLPAMAWANPSPIEVKPSNPDDDVVQLEWAMEEIQRRSGDGQNDGVQHSLVAPFQKLDIFGDRMLDGPAPLTRTNLTPSSSSIFAQAQAQTSAPLPLTTVPEKKVKEKIFGWGQTQKRLPLSAPPVPSKSEWGPQSSQGTSGVGISSDRLPYQFPVIFPSSYSSSGSPPRSIHTSQEAQAAPTLVPPKGISSTLRLSSVTMDTVRNVFSGVGARMNGAALKASANGVPAIDGSGRGKVGLGQEFGEMVMEAGEGDFMDLRDPFAPPPPSGRNKVDGGLERLHDFESEPVHAFEAYNLAGEQASITGPRRRMSAWGRLPMPTRPVSPALSAINGNVLGNSSKKTAIGGAQRAVRIVGKPSRKHKRKLRRSVVLSNMNGNAKPGAEDEDFGFEEAILSQRLLKRLDRDGWDVRI